MSEEVGHDWQLRNNNMSQEYNRSLMASQYIAITDNSTMYDQQTVSTSCIGSVPYTLKTTECVLAAAPTTPRRVRAARGARQKPCTGSWNIFSRKQGMKV